MHDFTSGASEKPSLHEQRNPAAMFSHLCSQGEGSSEHSSRSELSKVIKLSY